jgi:hypothetical protein
MIAKFTIAALAAGLFATGAATTALAAPTGTTATPVLAAFSTPLDNGHDNHGQDNHGQDNRGGGNDNRQDNDHGRGWDGDRNHDGDWDGHDWHWWHNWGISADLCRDGGGHVNWDQHRCDGGRFDDFHVR